MDELEYQNKKENREFLKGILFTIAVIAVLILMYLGANSCSHPVHVIKYDSGMEKTKTVILNNAEVLKLNKALKEGYKVEVIGYNEFEVSLTKDQIEKTKGKLIKRSALPKCVNKKLR